MDEATQQNLRIPQNYFMHYNLKQIFNCNTFDFKGGLIKK